MIKALMLIPAQFGRGLIPMLITAWIISGCSGSSDSVTADIQQPVVDSSSLDNALFVADPQNQNRIFVTFDITVPAYQSDALRIELDWGDVNLTAAWVGDELWTVSAELPTETEELLTVTFFDDNGAIELARFSQEFRTGSNAMEAFQVSVEQFDADQFDNDGDGVSNLDELIAGNDPTVDEGSLLEIFDTFVLFTGSRISVTSELENLLSEERPISTSDQEQISSATTIDTDIQIDSEGNGTLSRIRLFSCEFNMLSGIRTHAGNTISWEATRRDHDCDFSLRSTLSNTVTLIDENTRTLVEEVSAVRSGSFSNSWVSNTDITGQLIEGTSFCEAVSGTFSETFVSNNSGQTIFVTFVSKEIDDLYWRVVVERKERINFLTPDNFDVTTTEHFVRNLQFSRNESRDPSLITSDNPTEFKCDFVDI